MQPRRQPTAGTAPGAARTTAARAARRIGPEAAPPSTSEYTSLCGSHGSVLTWRRSRWNRATGCHVDRVVLAGHARARISDKSTDTGSRTCSLRNEIRPRGRRYRLPLNRISPPSTSMAPVIDGRRRCRARTDRPAPRVRIVLEVDERHARRGDLDVERNRRGTRRRHARRGDADARVAPPPPAQAEQARCCRLASTASAARSTSIGPDQPRRGPAAQRAPGPC